MVCLLMRPFIAFFFFFYFFSRMISQSMHFLLFVPCVSNTVAWNQGLSELQRVVERSSPGAHRWGAVSSLKGQCWPRPHRERGAKQSTSPGVSFLPPEAFQCPPLP